MEFLQQVYLEETHLGKKSLRRLILQLQNE